jgi:DNA-binding transcriptional regulator YdaS (Cro superfamily)
VNSPAAAADPDVISKGEFAKRRGVSPGRVSQWISERKVFGAALVGEGRAAQIRESVAVAQLRQKLDPMQMTANGLTTNLSPPTSSAPASPLPIADVLPFTAPPAAPSAPVPDDSVEAQIKAARLEQIARQNREGQRQEAVAAGRLTDAAQAKQIAGREASRLVNLFEGSLSNFATAISAEFKLPQRDVLHLMRREFRKFRAETTRETRARAEEMPALVEVDLSAEPEIETEDA